MPTCQPSKGPTEVRICGEFGRTDLFGPRSGGGAGAALASWADRIATATVARATMCVFLVISVVPLYLKIHPPSTWIDWPVTYSDSSEAKNATTFPISRGCPARPTEICATTLDKMAGSF